MSQSNTFFIGVVVGIAAYVAWSTYRLSKVAPEVLRRFNDEVERSYKRGKQSGIESERYGLNSV